MKKAAIIIASGFEEGEALTIADIIKRAHLQCDLVGFEQEVKGGQEIIVRCDHILNDKKFTAYQGYDQKIKQGTYLNDKVVIDSNIVTSRGPATAYGFAYKLVELLGGDDLAVKKRMVYFNAFDVKEDE